MIPSAEEINAGRAALRGLDTYEERKQRLRKSFMRNAFFGLVFVFGLLAMGGGLVVLIVATLLWFAPKIFIRLLLRIELAVHQRTLRRLREKYGSAIDKELEQYQ